MSPCTIYFYGVLLLLVGLELHSVDEFDLSPALSSVMAENIGSTRTRVKLMFVRTYESLTGTQFNVQPYPINPPNWVGWPFMSAGIIFIVMGYDRLQNGS